MTCVEVVVEVSVFGRFNAGSSASWSESFGSMSSADLFVPPFATIFFEVSSLSPAPTSLFPCFLVYPLGTASSAEEISPIFPGRFARGERKPMISCTVLVEVPVVCAKRDECAVAPI